MATSAKSPVRQKNKDCSSESSNVQIGIVHREAGLLLQHKPNPGHSLNPIQFKKNFFFFHTELHPLQITGCTADITYGEDKKRATKD